MSPDRLDRLYEGERDEFVAERNAAAKELRQEGRKDEADEVRRLKKPSVSAWALNQGIRADPKAAKAVLAAADALELAQAKALKGKATDLRAARQGEEDAAEGMLKAVQQAASGSNLSAATLDRVRETLRSIPGNSELRREFQAGRITADHRAIGFSGELASVSAGARKKAGSPTRRREAERRIGRARKDRDAAQRLVEQAREALAKLEDQTRHANRRVKEAEARLSKAESDLKKAEKSGEG